MKEKEKEKRREYQRDYQRRRRAKLKRVELVYQPEEYRMLKRNAKAHGLALAPFLKACIAGYLERTYVVPQPETVTRLMQSIRKIGSNVNQLVRHAHRAGLTEEAIHRLEQLVFNLEDEVGAALQHPEEGEDGR